MSGSDRAVALRSYVAWQLSPALETGGRQHQHLAKEIGLKYGQTALVIWIAHGLRFEGYGEFTPQPACPTLQVFHPKNELGIRFMAQAISQLKSWILGSCV